MKYQNKCLRKNIQIELEHFDSSQNASQRVGSLVESHRLHSNQSVQIKKGIFFNLS